jgi:hypothetical protein
MATISSYKTQTGQRYRVQIRHHSRHLKAQPLSRTFATRKEAMAWAKEEEQQLKSSPPQAIQHTQISHSVRDLIVYYREHHMPRKASNTQRAQRPLLNYWEKQIGHIALIDLTPATITKHRDSLMQGYKSGSVRQSLALLRRMLRVATEDLNWMDRNPMARMSLPKDSPPRHKVSVHK